MRPSAFAQKPRNGKAAGIPIPPPTGGWDAISALANMPADRAVQLDNWIPRPGWIEVRNGFIPWCNTVGTATTPVQTIMAYNGKGNIRKLFAAAGGTIFDVTLSGTGVATNANGFGSSRFQHKMFSNASDDQFLIAVNGTAAPWKYDGTTWAHTNITGDGIDQTKFVQVNAHKGRLWFAQTNSTNAVYLPIGAIDGPASIYPLGQLMTRGGYLQAIGTWTVDTRQTVNEYVAFITSRGQVIVFQGSDPADANDWLEVGTYDIAPPIGRRCYLRIAGDLILLTLDGSIGMSQVLSTDRAAINRTSITATILNAIAKAAETYKNNFGWQFIEYPKKTLAIMNIPVKENVESQQYVMNTITGAWCKFTGINANCWEVDSNDNIFFGGNNGTVYQWDVGSGDGDADIVAISKTAFNSFGSAAHLKHYKMLQPLINTNGLPIPSMGINVDFKDDAQLSTANPLQPDQAKWNEVNWNEFDWPLTQAITNDWNTVYGIGHYVSVVTSVTTSKNLSNPTREVIIQLNGWNMLAEQGGYV